MRSSCKRQLQAASAAADTPDAQALKLCLPPDITSSETPISPFLGCHVRSAGGLFDAVLHLKSIDEEQDLHRVHTPWGNTSKNTHLCIFPGHLCGDPIDSHLRSIETHLPNVKLHTNLRVVVAALAAIRQQPCPQARTGRCASGPLWACSAAASRSQHSPSPHTQCQASHQSWPAPALKRPS